jgi:hypothetical protein
VGVGARHASPYMDMFRTPRHAALLLLTCVLPGPAQQVEYVKVPPPVLEERLHRVTDKTADREQTLHELFESAGCKESSLDEQPVKYARTPNVVCTLAGADERRVVVGAHYDKVSNGHGVIDNWSGASLLPSLFEGLHGKPRRLTFVFIGFTDEEKGLVGSRYYVSHLTKGDKTKILAMVNIDSLGLSDTKIWLSRADKHLANGAAAVAHATNLPLGVVDVERVGESDSRPFFDARIPVIDFHSLTQDTFRILHSSKDAFPALRMKEYVVSCNLLVAYLAYLDSTLGASPSPAP